MYVLLSNTLFAGRERVREGDRGFPPLPLAEMLDPLTP